MITTESTRILPFICVPLLDNPERDTLVAVALIELSVPLAAGGTRIYLRRQDEPVYVDTCWNVHEIVDAMTASFI